MLPQIIFFLNYLLLLLRSDFFTGIYNKNNPYTFGVQAKSFQNAHSFAEKLNQSI